jgi:hypothetical protein
LELATKSIVVASCKALAREVVLQLANKGIKYARVNKLGKRYHLFGTHMDAG